MLKLPSSGSRVAQGSYDGGKAQWPVEEKGVGEERRKKDRCGDMWAPPPRGVYVSKTTLQNRLTVKCARY
jgi:hypothetical protein